MRGYVDLHCHYLPGIDDGVRTLQEGVALCRALRAIGYRRVVATPHIRTAMFDNNKAGLQASMQTFAEASDGEDGMPALGLAAEHFFDDVFWELFHHDGALPYPGGHAALVEFAPDSFPLHLEQHFFEMNVKGVRPVIAHPERYYPCAKHSDVIEPLLRVGALAQLDLMSLVGKYGRRAKKAAERMLGEGVYYLACSDSHRPEHVPLVEQAIERLIKLVGDAQAQRLLSEHPQNILDGEAESMF